jgi:hypothetical protein
MGRDGAVVGPPQTRRRSAASVVVFEAASTGQRRRVGMTCLAAGAGRCQRGGKGGSGPPASIKLAQATRKQGGGQIWEKREAVGGL